MTLDLAELKRIASRSQDIEIELKDELSKMVSTLEEICGNVQSSEWTASNQNLTHALTDVSNRIQTNLPRIIEFLNAQISSYEATNANTKA